MGKEAASIGGNTFQFFTRNPRGGKAKDIDPEDAKALIAFAEEHGFAKILAHAPYTLNAAAKDERVYEFARTTMADDLKRMEFIPGNYYNFHPGSHVGQGAEVGIEKITAVLNEILWEEQTTTVLLETMSGKGSEIGRSFEEIRAIIDGTRLEGKLGVCLDTCHVYSAGYDIVNNLDGVLEEFDRVIGLDRLKAVHLNDSMTPFASNKDRHEKIGDGSLGLPAIERFIRHEKLKDIPMFLETPNDLKGYEREITLLRELWGE